MAVPFNTGTKRKIGSSCEGELSKKTPKKLDQSEQVLTIELARGSIKDAFVEYHQLLDQKETDLLLELDQLETANKPELSQVNHDIANLSKTMTTLDETLGTNTLKEFLEEQKSVWNNKILNFERSQKFLTEVELTYSEFETFVDNIMEITPFKSKAQFRSELEPILELEPKIGEEWFVVSKNWFSEFSASINLGFPQPHDDWTFPESIPIDNLGIYENGQIIDEENCKVLHSKAWDLLLRFNGLSLGSSSIKRDAYLNTATNTVQIPLVPISHKCVILHNCGFSTQFSVEGELKAFPSETFENIIDKLSVFTKLYTDHGPLLYTFDSSDETCYDRKLSQYTIIRKCHPRSPLRPHGPIQHLSSLIGADNKSYLVVIPDILGDVNIQVVSNSSF